MSIGSAALLIRNNTGTLVDTSNAESFFDPNDLTATWDLSPLGLGPGTYYFELVDSQVANDQGQTLDGDSDGVPGGNYQGKIVIGNVIQEGLSNPEVVAVATNQGNDEYASLSSISVTFDEDVSSSLDASDLIITDSATEDQFIAESETNFAARRIRDTLCLLKPTTIEEMNHIVVSYGQQLDGNAAQKVRADSFVVETDIHYPAESSLIWDGLRKLIPICATLAPLLGESGWRQAQHLKKKAKRLAARSESH